MNLPALKARAKLLLSRCDDPDRVRRTVDVERQMVRLLAECESLTANLTDDESREFVKAMEGR